MKATIRFVLPLLVAGALAQAQQVKPYLRIETGAHTAAVRGIDVDADERFLVSASHDKTARVWDLKNGKLLKILRPPIGDFDEGMLYSVAISPDGTTVAVGGFTGADRSENHPIYIFDRESGVIRTTISGLPNVTLHLSYSKDGHYLAAALFGGNGIRIFKAPGYSEVARDAEYGGSSYSIEFDKAGSVVTTSDDGFVRLYSPQFRLLHKEKPRSGKEPFSARFSPDGKLLAVGFDDTAVVDALSAGDLSFQHSLSAPHAGGGFSSVSWSADGGSVCAAGTYPISDPASFILCWSAQGSVKRATGSPSTFPAAHDSIRDIHALNDGATGFCAGDGTVGVLERSGSIRWQAIPASLDFRSNVSQLSRDGSNIEISSSYFNGTSWTRYSIRFSVFERKLEAAPKSDSSLLAPVTDGLLISGWNNDNHPMLDGRALDLKEHEGSLSLAISHKDSFMLGTDWYIRKFDREGKEIWHTAVPSPAWGVNVTVDEGYAVATLGDGTIRWYTFDKGEEVLALYVGRDLHRWVAWNPDGFFASEGSGDALAGYHINRGPGKEGDFVKVDQLREAFYRPDLMSQILKPGGAEAVRAARNRIGDIAAILSGGLPPEMELISPAQAEITDEYLLQFRIKDKSGPHGRIVYRIDGAEIEGRGAVDIRGTGGDAINRSIPVGSGQHTLTVTAYSANGKIESQPRTIKITKRQPLRGPNLYVIAAGVSHYKDHSLWDGVKFAADDADLVAARFQEQEGKGLYGKVRTLSLPDRKATKPNIQNEVARLAKEVQPGDTFVLYLAGHGVAEDGEYYFVPWEAEYTNRKDWLNKSLDREAIQTLLKQIPTNKSVLILDTCSAGAFMEGRAGPSEKAAQEKIAVMSGRAVLAASNSDKMATEGYQNHGVFTYVLLEGLKQADGNAQSEILITRLAEYVQSLVPDITEKKWGYRQSPLSRIEGEPFPIARKPTN